MAFWPKRKGDEAEVAPATSAAAQAPAPAAVAAPVAGAVPMPDDQLARDLMVRVGRAIDDWAAANDLRGIPHSILFEQALSILNAFDRTAARPWAGRS